MSETIHSTGGRQATHDPAEPKPGRWIFFSCALLSILAVLGYLAPQSWHQASRLKQDLAAIQTERFYLGIQVRAGVRRLDSRLLRYQLSQREEERELFRRESTELLTQIETARRFNPGSPVKSSVNQLAAAFRTYLEEAQSLLDKGVRGIRRDTAALLAEEIEEKSKSLLALCERVIVEDRAAWQAVLVHSQAALQDLERLLRLTLLLLLACLGWAAFLVHRHFLTPLRVQLDQNQSRLLQQEKLASMGTLAAGVAHEIRNPLTAIKLRLFSLKASQPGLPENEDMQVIGQEISRLERIVHDFLQFARPSPPAPAVFQIEELFREVDHLLSAALLNRQVRLQMEPAPGMQIHGDKEQLKQVLINLVQNAGEAIESEGKIQLRAREGVAPFKEKSGAAVMVEVTDSGRGIAAELQPRIFDPFFSGREGGTGLGLPIAARIVEQHGGHIQFQTSGRGTTFTVVLPRDGAHVKDTAD